LLKRIVIVLLVLAGLAAAAWLLAPVYLRRSVAPYEGTIATGVSAPVQITFDARGIPQIWAKTDADAHFAIGWLHASERLFQMELVRRLANGELTEVFGEAAFDTDAEQRRRGFARRARIDVRSLSPEARNATQRYIDGINAYIAQAKMLPPEFVLLRFRPREWELTDCLAISGYQTWFSHELMDQDRRYQQIIEKIGMPAQALSRAGHPWSPPTVPGIPDLRMGVASNSWAVHASRSASKAALHASDPHLSIDQVPGLWYLAGLHSEEGLNIVGATYGGAPFVVMGHNDDIAFSFTVASVDVIDYYDDRAVGVLAKERIPGKGKSYDLTIHRGKRGVMIDDKTSMHWAGFDFSTAAISEAALRLQKAKNFGEFRRAVTRFGALDANWIYSDRFGNIGYQLGAPIPIRDYDSYVRQNANDPRTAWRGYRALEETPHALNPAQGFLASCNNQVVPAEWPYEIPGFYDPYRITRAHALLQSKRSREEMHAMQLDLTSGLALRWKSLAARASSAGNAKLLNEWDGRMSAGSRAATLFAAWWRMLPKAIFEDELRSDWNNGRVLVDEALTTRSSVLDDKRTPEIETIDHIAKRAMADAAAIANDRTWGDASTLLVKHPLSRVKVLDSLLHLNRGPYPAPGDHGSLNANFFGYDEASKSFRSRIGPSMRFVLDWSDVDSFSLVGALGQSGNPFSPHYDDFLAMMRRGERWNVPFSREKVFANKASMLTLTPGSSGTAR
jgi:penicillin G amidase